MTEENPKWVVPTGYKRTDINVNGLRIQSLGCGELLVTNGWDGTKSGLIVNFYQSYTSALIYLITSGGAGTISHCIDAKKGKADAVLLQVHSL